MEDRERIVEVEREPTVERHTTVVTTGGGGGGGTAIVAVLLVIVALVVLYFVFMSGGSDTPDPTDIDIKVDAPNVELPDVTPAKE